MNTTHPHHGMHLRLTAIVVAVLLTAVFHFTIAQYLAGIPLALFVAAIAVAVHVLLVVTGRRGNVWAYLFLLPALLAGIAGIIDSSRSVQFLSVPVGFGSLALFVYWISQPSVSFWRAKSLWSIRMVFETIMPFEGFGAIWSGMGVGRTWASVGIGVVVAIPLLFIFLLLFASADVLFSETLENLLQIEKVPEYIFKTSRDIMVGLFLLGTAWVFLTRRTAAVPVLEAPAQKRPNRVAAGTVLVLINALFAVFLAFQSVYFFGGQAVIEKYGITYASYARQGFFQLLVVAGLVFCITLVVYYATEMRDVLLRGLTLGLVGQTMVVIASAASRLLLYIDTYGYTLSRAWALAVVFLIGSVLVMAFAAALSRVRFAHMERLYALVTLCFFAVMLISNVSGFVARQNVNRFLTGKTKQMDVNYLLRQDASIPELSRLALAEWPTPYIETRMCDDLHGRNLESCDTYNGKYDHAWLRDRLLTHRQSIEKNLSSLRTATLADLRALAALEKIDK